MKIGLISDTHSYLDPQVFKSFESCDEIWHAGDIGDIKLFDELMAFKPTKAVYGNIDNGTIRTVCPEVLDFMCEGLRIFMTHIGGRPPKYNPKVLKMIQENPPDVFICGHSHILKVARDPYLNSMLFINPGAAGNHGFHKVRTIVRFEIKDGLAKNMEIVELQPRRK